MAERLQKYMAGAGIGSRRHCESLIRAGRVTVNGSVAELGRSVEPGVDTVLFDGREIVGAERQVYVALNKPAGVLSSRRSQGGLATVIDFVDVPQRVYPVGRLDADSEGLVLLTNDGDLTYRLTHPKFGQEKEYRVRLDRTPAEGDLQSWRAGVEVPELGRTHPAAVRRESADGRWIRVVMHEGKNREIRRLAAALGYDVERLIRLRIGRLELGSMKHGEWRHLRPSEVAALQVQVDAAADGVRTTADTA